MTWSASVRRLRLARGWRQEQFAARVGCTVSTVNRWENGARRPTSSVVMRAVAAVAERHGLSFQPEEEPADTDAPSDETQGGPSPVAGLDVPDSSWSALVMPAPPL